MNWTKSELKLVSVVAVLLLVIVNVVAHFCIVKILDVSIFDSEYGDKQKKYLKFEGKSRVHPFYGLASAGQQGFESPLSVENNFYSTSPIHSNNPIYVLVLGGSVATQLSKDYMLANELNSYFETDKFVVYNAAFGGGKQPQQYFKLLYLELLGFTPNIIINYDGFNEVALTFGENYGRNINAIYPRAFDRTVISSTYDGGCFTLNNWFLSKNTYVPAIEIIKWLYVRDCHNKSTGYASRIQFTPSDLILTEQNDFLNRVQLIWRDSSNMIARFAELNKIPYLHILQPNQYLIGSKPLSDTEIEQFYDFEMYKNPIENYYATLNMEWLDAEYTIDHRNLFNSEERTVYSDNCCHFNRIGIKTIVTDIIERASPMFLKVLHQ